MTGVEVFGLASTQRDDLRESTATNGRRMTTMLYRIFVKCQELNTNERFMDEFGFL